MQQRVNIQQSMPEVWEATYGPSGAIKGTGLTPIQKLLITMRASQINPCAFCMSMHTTEALKAGESQQRIFLLSAWRETTLFTPEEQAILALTEEVTRIHQHGVSDETYSAAKAFFDDETIGQIISIAVLINAWNRIAISTHLAVAAV